MQAAEEALRKVAGAVAEEGVYLLVAQLDKGLEDPSRRLASANLIKFFCQTSKLDFQEHVPALITVRLLHRLRSRRASDSRTPLHWDAHPPLAFDVILPCACCSRW